MLPHGLFTFWAKLRAAEQTSHPAVGLGQAGSPGQDSAQQQEPCRPQARARGTPPGLPTRAGSGRSSEPFGTGSPGPPGSRLAAGPGRARQRRARPAGTRPSPARPPAPAPCSGPGPQRPRPSPPGGATPHTGEAQGGAAGCERRARRPMITGR